MSIDTSPAALLALAEHWYDMLMNGDRGDGNQVAYEMADALRVVADEKRAQQWQPIESAPKDETTVLLRDKDGAIFSASWEARFIGEHDDGGDCWTTTQTQWRTRDEGRVDYFDYELNGWRQIPKD